MYKLKELSSRDSLLSGQTLITSYNEVKEKLHSIQLSEATFKYICSDPSYSKMHGELLVMKSVKQHQQQQANNKESQKCG